MARRIIESIEREAGNYLLRYATRVIQDMIPARDVIASQFYGAIDHVRAYRHARTLARHAEGEQRETLRREAVTHYAAYRRLLRKARAEAASLRLDNEPRRRMGGAA